MRSKENVKTSHISPALCTELFEGLLRGEEGCPVSRLFLRA